MEEKDDFNIIDKKSVNNELLGNVLRGMLYDVDHEEIINSVEPFFNEDDVYEARRLLVINFNNLFENEEPQGRNMGPKERQIKKKDNLTDVIYVMSKVTRMDHDIEFCVPWNYSYVMVSEEEKRFRDLVCQKDLEIDAKFDSLEKVIGEKNKEMIATVEDLMKVMDKNIDGEVYIHASDLDDAANNQSAAPGSGSGSITYTRRIFDIQILNSLIVFCLFGFLTKFVQNLLNIFVINI